VFRVEVEGLKEIQAVMLRMQRAVQEIGPTMDSQAPALAEVIEEAIMQASAGIPGIGEFMASRTKITTAFGPGIITLSIQGMTEEEAGFPHSSGSVHPDTNLWNWHEFGPSGEYSGGAITYEKDTGGVKAQGKSKRKVRAAGMGSKYKGAVHDTISGLTTQLEKALQALWSASAYGVAASKLSRATGGKIKIPRGMRATMKAAGHDESSLAALGVGSVKLTSTGQIIAFGSTGKRMPMKAFGIPTKVQGR
jgi:hypothetical protein